MTQKFKKITEEIKQHTSKLKVNENIKYINSKKSLINLKQNNNENINSIDMEKNKAIPEFNNLVVDLKEFTGHLVVKKDQVEEEINETNYNRIKIEAETKHPRVFKDNKLSKIPIFSSQTGIFGCCNPCSKSDFNSFGFGMNIYFKTIKSLILVFFIIAIFNIPLNAMYYYNSVKWGVKDYKDALFKTTIGNIASSKIN